MTSGPDFYDEEDVFGRYMQGRQRPDNPNDTIEGPAFMQVLDHFQQKDILDLGCGDGRFGVELLAGGCRSYTGVEASTRMVNAARERLETAGGVVHHAAIEDWTYPKQTFDLVISRLALHYVNDIAHLFQLIHRALKPGGRFIFSVEHPVLTSHNGAATPSGVRYHWIVDDYFVTGVRDVTWMGSRVNKYHRTIEDYFTCLQQAQFAVERLLEPRPHPELFTDDQLYARRLRIPLFLLMAARRGD